MYDPVRLLRFVNGRHGTHYRLVRCAIGGESGTAWPIRNETGEEYFLKCGGGSEFRARETRLITSRLRKRGYRLADYVIVSPRTHGYTIQKKLDGKPPVRLNSSLVQQVLKLNRLQQKAAIGLPN